MPETLRNKCGACYKQFNRKDHLVEHMKTSYHSVHEPKCGVCNKHCRSFESLREHLMGYLPKAACNSIFSSQGCDLCLTIFNSPNALMLHRTKCQLPPLNIGLLSRLANIGTIENLKFDGPKVVAMACKMVGGGTDGSIDLCARLCLIDQHENIIFHTYVKPPIPVTNYRYEFTGIRPEMLRDAMPLRQVKAKIENFLCNGEPVWKIRPGSDAANRAKVVVGYGLDHDLGSLQIEYPPSLIRDATKYPPLVKSNKISDSLKELAKTYLGYDMSAVQNPYEDCVAAMRIYMRLRSSQVHGRVQGSGFGSWRQADLEKMTPQQLLSLSTSDYYCWCLDS